MQVTLYSTHCPRCKALEMKLKQKQINYTLIDDNATVLEAATKAGLTSAPFLDVDGQIYDFSAAIKYANEQ